MIKPRFKTGSQEHDTSLTLENPKTGEEYDADVRVVYSIQPPEPDVGIDGGIEIEGVYFEDEGCLMGDMTDYQLECLAEEINDYNVSSWEAAQEDYR